MKRHLCTVAVLSLACVVSMGRAEEKSLEADQTLINTVMPSLAVAEIGVKPDKGEEPYGAGWGSRCPNCGQVHNNSISTYVEEERPFEVPAFIVGPDLAVIPDPLMHERFLQSIKVRQGNESVGATIIRYYTAQRAVLLKLDKPLPDAKPLEFEPGDTKDLKTIVYAEGNGRWNVTVSAFSSGLTQTAAGPRINTVTRDSLIVTPAGKARGLVFSESLPVDNSWIGSPLDWAGRTSEELTAHREQMAATVGNSIVRVHLGFRSPRLNAQEQMGMRFGGHEDENATERDFHGVVVAPNRVLVLATLRPDVTARLERVSVFTRDGTSISGKFLCSLKDYGALIIETDQPLTPVKLSDASYDALVGPALMLAEVRIAGEDRTDYISRTRLSGLAVRWRRNLYPELALDSEQQKSAFVFDDRGLVALPLMVRPKPKAEKTYRWDSSSPKLTFARQLASIFADPVAAADSNNVPLSEEEQNRLAWLGVELQPLTPELARLNKVSQLTKDGESGALVTYVYPDSPAAKAGISVGAVLLRLHMPDQPKPIDIEADEYLFAERPFPWDRYDEFPEAFFDRMPHPWPSAATTLSRALTEIGFGQKVTVELFQGGKGEMKPIEITQSPAYYDSAHKVKHAPTGLTLRTMTYEVRRYFQIKPDAPGVLISGIEQGSCGSKAGLKPYEYVTAVNGQPVTTADDFVNAAEGQAELRLDVMRMNKSRVVKIKLPTPASAQPATVPTTQP